jgi:hypothetical protein
MNTASSTPSPSPPQKATIVREYGPFPVGRAGGVSGVEAKGDLLFCGGIKAPVVRAVRRPART